MSSKNNCTLAAIPVGMSFTITELKSLPETNHRLRELGINENVQIKTVSINSTRIICEIHNTRIGLRRRVAEEIFVTPDGVENQR